MRRLAAALAALAVALAALTPAAADDRDRASLSETSAIIGQQVSLVVEVFTERPGVTRARMMGCEGLRIAGKYFAYEWRGELVVKLPREKVDAYVAAGHGKPFDPGMGRPMKEWLTVPPGVADWRNLAEQAFAFVAATL